MNIVLDCDGCLLEGTHVAAPDADTAYLDLGPYDADTVALWNLWTREHNVTLLTSRHCADALGITIQGLRSNHLRMPTSIITHVVPEQKGGVAKALGAHLFVDDSVEAFIGAVCANVPFAYLMHNEGWPENKEHYAGKYRLRSWAELRRVVDGCI